MKKIFVWFAIGFAFSACKKDAAVPATSEVLISPHSVSTASVYSGAFVAGNYTVVNSFGTSASSDVRASFYNPPQANKKISPGMEINELRLNGRRVSYDYTHHYYIKNDWNLDDEQVWIVEGNNSITSFNFRIKEPTPSCTNFNVIPDSVSHGDGFTLHIPGVTNATPGARIIIYDSNYNEITSKPLVNGDNSVSFSTSDFTYFGATGFILIQLENNHAYNFYGQDFIFVKAKGFMKEVKFKP